MDEHIMNFLRWMLANNINVQNPTFFALGYHPDGPDDKLPLKFATPEELVEKYFKELIAKEEASMTELIRKNYYEDMIDFDDVPHFYDVVIESVGRYSMDDQRLLEKKYIRSVNYQVLINNLVPKKKKG